MSKRCVIVSAGSVSTEMKRRIVLGDYVIACDAGWKRCEMLGVQPDLVVGDFDSSPKPEAHENTVVLPHIKDDTDTQFAAAEAVRRGFDSVLMIGALGGARLEHTLANLGTALWLEKHGVTAVIENERSRLSFIAPGRARTFARGDYRYLSVFPAEGRAEGVQICGAFYPLENAVLEGSYPLGVSNEFVESDVSIGTQAGYLLVIETIAD